MLQLKVSDKQDSVIDEKAKWKWKEKAVRKLTQRNCKVEQTEVSQLERSKRRKWMNWIPNICVTTQKHFLKNLSKKKNSQNERGECKGRHNSSTLRVLRVLKITKIHLCQFSLPWQHILRFICYFYDHSAHNSGIIQLFPFRYNQFFSGQKPATHWLLFPILACVTMN